MPACKSGSVNVVRELIANDANVNVRTANGLNLLMFASSVDVVGKLHYHDDDVNINVDGRYDTTPLIFATHIGWI